MRKLLFIWTYFTLFFIFYKKSKRFRFSLIVTLAGFNFFMLPVQEDASELDLLSTSSPKVLLAFKKEDAKSVAKSLSSSGDGSNNNNDNGNGDFPKNERVEQTQERVEQMGKRSDFLKNRYKKRRNNVK